MVHCATLVDGFPARPNVACGCWKQTSRSNFTSLLWRSSAREMSHSPDATMTAHLPETMRRHVLQDCKRETSSRHEKGVHEVYGSVA